MRQSRTSRFIVGLMVGALLGFAVTAALPDEVFVRLHQDWGIWGLVGRGAIAILLLGIPIAYVGWLVSSSLQAIGPRRAAPTAAPPEAAKPPREINRILVPVSGGANALLGLDLAGNLASAGGANKVKLTLMQVVAPAATATQIDAAESRLQELAERHLGDANQADILVTSSPSVVQAIVREAQIGHYDLLMVGASDRPSVRTLLFGSVPHALAEQAPCPVVIVRLPALSKPV